MFQDGVLSSAQQHFFMLTDDAIVVSENITARKDFGETPQTAAIRGGEQVFWPVVGSVTTTIVAFVPLVFIKGNIGELLGNLPTVVLIALAASLSIRCRRP